MINLKFTLILAAISVINLVGCNSSESILEETKKELLSEKEDLNIDILKFRQKNLQQIEANIKSIEDFNSIIDIEEKIVKVSYKAKIDELELKNTGMRIKLDNYQEEGKKHWDGFKCDFKADMDKLNIAFKEVSKNASHNMKKA